MTAHRILQINAVSTGACALGIFAARPIVPSLFGLEGPVLLDTVGVGLAAYALVSGLAASRETVRRRTLIVFTVADALWVIASGVVLVLFWTELAAIARALIIVVALTVELFAVLQFRAARFVGRSAEAV